MKLVSGNLNRTLRYFEAVDQAEGRSSRMAFYNIAGNEENLRRWEKKLCEEWRIVEKFEEDGREYYRKTDLGDPSQAPEEPRVRRRAVRGTDPGPVETRPPLNSHVR